MLTRNDVAKQYNVDSNGVVRSPGKFEGEAWQTVAMWELSLEGCADDSRDWTEDESEDIFILDDELRAALNCNATEYAYILHNSPAGFVYGITVDRETFEAHNAEYEKHCEDQERQEAEQQIEDELSEANQR